MRVADDWNDYKIIDSSNGQKLEKWNNYILVRPDPQIIWNTFKEDVWNNYDGYYNRSDSGGGYWDFKKSLPESWNISYKNLNFIVKPTGFKHTGVFPEQAVNWNFVVDIINRNKDRDINVLNLFGYTGGATLACASAGAKVCHVDASKGIVQWAKQNAAISNLEDKPIRFIVDDCEKFIKKEIRRGKKYDAIIMDPPSYGRGSNGEIWKLEENIYHFLELCLELLSDNPLFLILNSYAKGISSKVMEYLLNVTIGNRHKGVVFSDEIGLPVESCKLNLPCGSTAIWSCL